MSRLYRVVNNIKFQFATFKVRVFWTNPDQMFMQARKVCRQEKCITNPEESANVGQEARDNLNGT